MISYIYELQTKNNKTTTYLVILQIQERIPQQNIYTTPIFRVVILF